MAQNNSWTATIPSDIKPGKYVVRHELIALQFAADGNPQGAGTVTAGAQFYPICLNVEVTGTGTNTPAGVKFPGGYSPSEPGIIYDLFEGLCLLVLREHPLTVSKVQTSISLPALRSTSASTTPLSVPPPSSRKPRFWPARWRPRTSKPSPQRRRSSTRSRRPSTCPAGRRRVPLGRRCRGGKEILGTREVHRTQRGEGLEHALVADCAGEVPRWRRVSEGKETSIGLGND